MIKNMSKTVTVEQVEALVLERSTWSGRGKRVTASTLMEKFGIDLSVARDLMNVRSDKVELRLNKGTYTNAVLVLKGSK